MGSQTERRRDSGVYAHGWDESTDSHFPGQYDMQLPVIPAQHFGGCFPSNEFPGPVAVQNPDLPGKTPAQLATLLLLYPQQSSWVAAWHCLPAPMRALLDPTPCCGFLGSHHGRPDQSPVHTVHPHPQLPCSRKAGPRERAVHMLRLQSGLMT